MVINDYLIEDVTRCVIREYLHEARPRNVGDDIITNRGRKPKRLSARIKQINQKIKKYGLMKRRYDSEEKVMDDYRKVINSFGCEFQHDNGRYVEQPTTENGANIGKVYGVKIIFGDDIIIGSITLVGYGTKENPLSEFTTGFSLLDKQFTNIEN